MRTRSANGGCSSWYLDANGRNTTIWPDFTWRFWQQTRQFDEPADRFAHGTGRAQWCREAAPTPG